MNTQAIAHIEQAIDIRRILKIGADPETVLKHWTWLDDELEMALAALYPADPPALPSCLLQRRAPEATLVAC